MARLLGAADAGLLTTVLFALALLVLGLLFLVLVLVLGSGSGSRKGGDFGGLLFIGALNELAVADSHARGLQAQVNLPGCARHAKVSGIVGVADVAADRVGRVGVVAVASVHSASNASDDGRGLGPAHGEKEVKEAETAAAIGVLMLHDVEVVVFAAVRVARVGVQAAATVKARDKAAGCKKKSEGQMVMGK